MKSFMVVMVGLVLAGTMAGFSGFALAAPAAIESYVQAMPEPGLTEMVLAALAVMVFVASRGKPKIH